MGGNRVSPIRKIFNLFVVWAVTGFWHGANWNFIFWGLFFFVIIVLEKNLIGDFLNKHKIFSHVYVIFLLLISWAIFEISDMGQLGLFFGKMFSMKGGTDWIYYIGNYGITFVIAAIFSTPWLKKYYEKLKPNGIAELAMFSFIFIFSVAYLVDSNYNPFLYFNF